VTGYRWRWVRRIEELDPVRDHQQIHRITATYEFPWDYQRSLELALFRTYCVPSVSALLDATGEFRDRPQQRYDDTALLMAELTDHGYDSERGREALRVINRAHGRYAISNDDMRYVLSTFVYEPLDWLDRFGWRPLTETERRASANYYRELGRHMNIKDSPGTYQEFAAYLDAYERAHFAYSPGGRAVSDSTLALLTSFSPRPLRPLMRRLTLALLDPPLREAFRYPRPDPVTRALAAELFRDGAP